MRSFVRPFVRSSDREPQWETAGCCRRGDTCIHSGSHHTLLRDHGPHQKINSTTLHSTPSAQDKKIPIEFDYIRGLKDVTLCRFTANPSWVEATDNGSKAEAAGGFYWSTDVVSPYACPISQVEMNGKVREQAGRGA